MSDCDEIRYIQPVSKFICPLIVDRIYMLMAIQIIKRYIQLLFCSSGQYHYTARSICYQAATFDFWTHMLSSCLVISIVWIHSCTPQTNSDLCLWTLISEVLPSFSMQLPSTYSMSNLLLSYIWICFFRYDWDYVLWKSWHANWCPWNFHVHAYGSAHAIIIYIISDIDNGSLTSICHFTMHH